MDENAAPPDTPAGLFRPYGALISYVLRNADVPDVSLKGETSDFITYIGPPENFDGSEVIEKLAYTVPDEWKKAPPEVLQFRPRRTGDYTEVRYFVRFADDDDTRDATLLNVRGYNSPFGSLVNSFGLAEIGNTQAVNIRHGSGVSLGFAVIVVYDLKDVADSPGKTNRDPESAFEVAQLFNRELVKSDKYWVPSLHLDLIFTAGPVYGDLLHSAAVLRLHPPKPQPDILVPRSVRNWIDFADSASIVSSLTACLDNSPIMAGALRNYLPSLSKSDLASLYESFTRDRLESLRTYVDGRETVNQLRRDLKNNVFDERFGASFSSHPEDTPISYFRRVLGEYQSQMYAFESSENKFVSRERLISDSLGDAIGWVSARSTDRLTRTVVRLTVVIVVLTVVVIGTSIMPESSKHDFFDYVGSWMRGHGL